MVTCFARRLGDRMEASRLSDSVVLVVAIAAAVAAAVPIVGYLFGRPGSWLDPYGHRGARWLVYLGAGTALLLFLYLARD
jgi:hypothetical protein